jgi:hypothetical protein
MCIYVAGEHSELFCFITKLHFKVNGKNFQSAIRPHSLSFPGWTHANRTVFTPNRLINVLMKF